MMPWSSRLTDFGIDKENWQWKCWRCFGCCVASSVVIHNDMTCVTWMVMHHMNGQASHEWSSIVWIRPTHWLVGSAEELWLCKAVEGYVVLWSLLSCWDACGEKVSISVDSWHAILKKQFSDCKRISYGWWAQNISAWLPVVGCWLWWSLVAQLKTTICSVLNHHCCQEARSSGRIIPTGIWYWSWIFRHLGIAHHKLQGAWPNARRHIVLKASENVGGCFVEVPFHSSTLWRMVLWSCCTDCTHWITCHMIFISILFKDQLKAPQWIY